MADNSAFISYRRGVGYPWARLIWDDLQDRSINAFLDLESMRQAGRFDERILNQIAARPYFLMVLAEGSLDRCASESDWVRREIEHAIETNRTVVPLFIAPFEASHFPLDLPPHIGEALANSNGVTFYSQFLAAALDQLAGFLKPVALSMGELTDDDDEFEQRVISQVRAEPTPIVPITPYTETPLAPEPLPDVPDAVPPIRTDMAGEAGGSNSDWVPPPGGEASQTTTSAAVAAGATTGSIGGGTASVQTGREEARPGVVHLEPTPGSHQKGILVASAVAVALVVGGIAALTLLGGDDGGDTTEAADTTEVADTTEAADTTEVADTPSLGCPEKSSVVFCDNFDGTMLDPAKWSVSENEGTVVVSNGEVLLRSRGRSFPFIVARAPFPDSGPFRLTVRLRFSEAGDWGTGFKAEEGVALNGRSTDPIDERVIAKVWQDTVSGWVIETECGSLPMPTDIGSHMVVFEYEDSSRVRVWLDDKERDPCSESRRPDSLWLGNPTAPPEGEGGWTSVSFDLVRVDSEW